MVKPSKDVGNIEPSSKLTRSDHETLHGRTCRRKIDDEMLLKLPTRSIITSSAGARTVTFVPSLNPSNYKSRNEAITEYPLDLNTPLASSKESPPEEAIASSVHPALGLGLRVRPKAGKFGSKNLSTPKNDQRTIIEQRRRGDINIV